MRTNRGIMAKTEKATTTYAQLVSEAEAAVAAVKDPELKRVAFEKILGTLLEQRSSSEPRGKSRNKKEAKKQAAPSKGRSGPTTYIQELIDDAFFSSPKTIAEVKAELANRG